MIDGIQHLQDGQQKRRFHLQFLPLEVDADLFRLWVR